MIIRWTSFGPLADALDPQLAVPALERQLLGDAHAAVDLHRSGRRRGPRPRSRRPWPSPRGAGTARPRSAFQAALERDPARLLEVDLVVDDHPLDRLARRERLAERRAHLRVLDRHLLRAHRDADAARRVGDALARDAVAGDREAACSPRPGRSRRARGGSRTEARSRSAPSAACGSHDGRESPRRRCRR